MGNDYQNFLAGKDWYFTVTVPNHLVGKYPSLVRELELRLKMELDNFNVKVKKAGSEKFKAVIEQINKDQLKVDPVVLKKVEDEKKQREGGGGNTL